MHIILEQFVAFVAKKRFFFISGFLQFPEALVASRTPSCGRGILPFLLTSHHCCTHGFFHYKGITCIVFVPYKHFLGNAFDPRVAECYESTLSKHSYQSTQSTVIKAQLMYVNGQLFLRVTF